MSIAENIVKIKNMRDLIAMKSRKLLVPLYRKVEYTIDTTNSDFTQDDDGTFTCMMPGYAVIINYDADVLDKVVGQGEIKLGLVIDVIEGDASKVLVDLYDDGDVAYAFTNKQASENNGIFNLILRGHSGHIKIANNHDSVSDTLKFNVYVFSNYYLENEYVEEGELLENIAGSLLMYTPGTGTQSGATITLSNGVLTIV